MLFNRRLSGADKLITRYQIYKNSAKPYHNYFRSILKFVHDRASNFLMPPPDTTTELIVLQQTQLTIRR